MDSEHSPAPWKEVKYSDLNILAADGLVVVPEVWGASLPQCEANYRLISAAPDLLEACKAVFAELDGAYWHGDHAGRAIAQQLKAAIAKAESVPIVTGGGR